MVLPRSFAIFIATLIVTFVSPGGFTAASAEVLFEGYSKVSLGGVQIGYVAERFEFDGKKKEFVTTYYLKTNSLGGGVTESVKARSTATLEPIGYQYTGIVGDKVKTIDATFTGGMMTAQVKDGQAPPQTIKKTIPKGAFLSHFLVFVMLQGKEGIKPGANYTYMAIAEEDAAVYQGEAYIQARENHNGLEAYKVLNTFNNTRFVAYVTLKGEILSTRAPVQGLATELMPTMQAATQGQSVNSQNLTLIFGNVPKGIENAVARKAAGAPAPEKIDTVQAPPPGGKEKVAPKKLLEPGKNPISSQTAAPIGNTAPAAPTPAPASGQASPAKQKDLNSAPPKQNVDTPKKFGVPAGQGMILKGSPTTEQNGK